MVTIKKVSKYKQAKINQCKSEQSEPYFLTHCNLVCVEVLRLSQPNGVMSSAVSLPNHTFTGQA